ASIGIGVTKEQVTREFHAVAQLAAKYCVHRNTELLAHDVETRELERGVQLRAVVVEARGGVADLEAHRLEREHVVAEQVIFERLELTGGILAAAAHLPEPHVAIRGLDLDDGTHETSPVRAVAVTQRCF